MEKINKLLLGIIAIWVILAAIFGIFDLAISKYAVSFKDASFFDFGNDYGNQVDRPLLFVSITILIGSIFNNIKMQRRVGEIMIFYTFIYLAFMLIRSELYSSAEFFEAYLMITCLGVFYFLAYNKNWRNYLLIAVLISLLYFFSNVIVDLMKVLWGRVRYENLSSDSEFTAWYIINGSNSNDNSFPSGHTASAFTFLPLLILIRNKNLSNKMKAILIISVIGFGLYVAIGRVVIGKHYASDVLFSAAICSILTISFYKIFQNTKFFKDLFIANINNSFHELKYSELTNQWLGYYYNEKGRKIWTWFDSNDEALEFYNNLQTIYSNMNIKNISY